MFSSHEVIARRVNVCVNTAVVLIVLLGVFAGTNWERMPSGLGGFLAIRVTVKNLIVTAMFLTACTGIFYALTLQRFRGECHGGRSC
jgi:hypothetical protein